ncbi:uncharacterized protein LOC128553593 [Mercenaria mercenaria]|uniref:uncharacterized protein LOC128553593 n=1 Tax=Mercenaria mercenaria TaxID=6596 RepID=UPI00234E64DE|nr:uncharacterized protein LOC128553593 [Mercenaria mercenaria]
MSDLSLLRKKIENEKKRFVETKAYKAAKEKLLKNNLVILKGNAGEGKTTMAKMLLFDMENSERVWNVSSYNDWSGIDLKDHDVIIIDDIFGACVIDLDKCNNWRNTFSEISSMVGKKKIKVIITCRSHIMNEAIDKAFHPVLAERKNVQTLELDKKEMEQILRKHLEATGKENEVDINECLIQANLKQSERILPIGFPEIIADVVGIVSFEINSTAVFECCDFEFAMKYITIERQAIENVCVVEQYQFDQLSLRLTEFMNLENGRIDGPPLDHNAFTNSEFCTTFINESMANNDILSASVVVEDGTTPKDIFLENGVNVDLTEFRMASYSIWKKEGRSALANEWFRAFAGADQYNANTMDCTEDIFGQNKRASRRIVLDTNDRNHESELTAGFDACENVEHAPDEDSIKTELYLAVMFAIKFGNISLLKALFMYGAKVADDMITLAWLQISKPNTRVSNGILQHLCTECEHGNFEEPGTSLTRLNEQLKSLIKSGSEFEVVTLLKCNIRYGYLVENDQYTALHFACKLGKTEIVLSILRQFAKLDTADKKGYFPIHYATRNGHIETVKAILNNDIQQADRTLDADTKWLNGATLLHIAVDKEHIEMIKYLTDKRKFSVDNLERTPLMFALKHKKFKSIHCLLECENIDKKTPDKDGYHPLHIAIMQSKAFEEDEYKGQNVDSVEPHLHSSVNFFNSNRTTSLHKHCSVCWLEIVDKLLQNDNVELDDVNASGVTPLQLASANRQDSIVILLQNEICFRYYTRHWQKE